MVFSESLVKEIQDLFKNYPSKRPALIMALHAVQRDHGCLSPEAFEELGELFDEHPGEIESVASFYTMFHFEPIGKCLIEVCTNASCMIMGSDDIVDHILKKLDIKLGETTSDGLFTVKEAECLAACDMAPIIIIDEKFEGPLTKEKADKLIDEWRRVHVSTPL